MPSSSSFKSPQDITQELTGASYNRQRLSPEPGDQFYIHLSDVRVFLQRYTGENFDHLLDYGCGGSPYRALFQASEYIRADYVDFDNLDCLISENGQVSLPDNSCDCVLSTQVLEHVSSPQMYLSEALRVLRPGGKLILTTHGLWEDHGCPYDFRRWTYDGLKQEIEGAGFQVRTLAKLTTGPRAILFLFGQILGHLHDRPWRLASWAFRLLRRSSFGVPRLRDEWLDRAFAGHRAVYDGRAGHGLYLALGVEALKPNSVATPL